MINLAKKLLIALGGNAILKAREKGTFEEQMKNIEIVCNELIKIIEMGFKVIITHGNGPQVGNLAIQQEYAIHEIPAQPLHILNAMTQGQIGYMIQQTLRNKLIMKGINKPVITIITQVLVDPEDPAFKKPTKPIGPFYTKEIALLLQKERGYTMAKVLKTGDKVYRRVVPSPDPIKVVEGEVIKYLVNMGIIVIASGGGGIPVVSEGGVLKGVDAVIDKDLAGEKLCEAVGADIFLILTDVEKVKLNYGTPYEKDIDVMSLEEAKKYYEEGHFPPGSMGPKILACIRFLEWGGERAIITSINKASEAIKGRAGTHIIKKI